MLVLQRQQGERILIDDAVLTYIKPGVISINDKVHSMCLHQWIEIKPSVAVTWLGINTKHKTHGRLGFVAPRSVQIVREEVANAS